MGLFDKLGRAFSKFWEELNTPEGTSLGEPAPTRPISDTEPFFPHAVDTDRDDVFNHGTDRREDFPSTWGAPQFRLWETEPNTYRSLYDEYPSQWRDVIGAFDKGWIRKGMDPEARESYRLEFYSLTGMTPGSFDWRAYRAYIAEVGS